MTALPGKLHGAVCLLLGAALAAGCDRPAGPAAFVAPNDRTVVVYSTFDDAVIAPACHATRSLSLETGTPAAAHQDQE